MPSNERPTGELWAVIQEWMDAIRFPPSQRQLAFKLEVSPSAVTAWKYCEGFPTAENLHRLAAEIGVPYEVVLDAVLVDQGYREKKAQNRGAS